MGCASMFTPTLDRQKNVRTFVAMMVKKYNFNQKELLNLFQQVKIQPRTLTNIQHPYEEQPWYIYRNHLITPRRINDGLHYWQQHATVLQYAQNKYGIPASIIVAIIGIESNYGQTQFQYRTFDALATLSFCYPKRAPFFKQELEEYLLLIQKLNVDPLSIYGSYAGAIGPAQFMPSTYRRFAVSYKPAQTPDIINNHNDAIVSVANFLKQQGWQAHRFIAVRAKITNNTTITSQKQTIAQFAKHGIIAPKKIARKNWALFIPLQEKNSFEYWLGLNNFMVLMRYNSNINYAMAVYSLSSQLISANHPKAAKLNINFSQ